MNINHQLLSSETKQIQEILSNQTNFYLSQKESETLYDRLVETIVAHNHLYYVNNTPIISDIEYDKLFTAIKTIESSYPDLIRDDSPTQRLVGQLSHPLEKGGLGGFDIQTEFMKSNHQVPILSLQNTYNSEDIRERHQSITTMLNKKVEDIEDESKKKKWELKVKDLKFIIEPKYDGLSIVLTYHNGKLYKAVTRGDGYTGDDVTENIKTIKNLPQLLSPLKGEMSEGQEGSKSRNNTIILRWEVLMPKSTRKRINQEREENGEEAFANTRNAAAWSLKLLDTNEVAKRWLACYVYDILSPLKRGIKGDHILEHFSQYTTPPDRTNISIDEVINIINNPETKDTLLQADIDFDGLVIKIIDPETRELLGSTNHHPRRAIAYKFPAQQIATQIESIERQVGRTGILTPVANLTPTELSGVTISRVSLHNRDFITSKNIQISDRVRLQRSGEVIPYIVGVITNRRDGSTKKIDPDEIHCPACQTPAEKVENIVGTKSKPETTTQFICPNHHCPGILKEQLKHFVSKNCMNISSIGEAIIELLVDQHILTSLSDIYTLSQSEKIFVLKRLPGIADKKIDTFVDEINKSKTNPFRRLLNGLWISGIGIKLAKEITSQLEKCGWSDIRNLEEAFSIITNQEFISSIFGIGDKLIEELLTRYTDKSNKKLLKTFQKYWLTVNLGTKNKELGTNKWTICITWTFPLSRNELEFYIWQAGYIFSPNLTKSIDYLLVGEHAGSKKDKIWQNTKIIDNREQICTMLDISTPLFIPHESVKKSGSLLQWWQAEMQSLF